MLFHSLRLASESILVFFWNTYCEFVLIVSIAFSYLVNFDFSFGKKDDSESQTPANFIFSVQLEFKFLLLLR